MQLSSILPLMDQRLICSTSRELRQKYLSALQWTCAAVVMLLAVASLLPSGVLAQEKKLSVYTPQSNYSVSLVEQNGAEYVGLVDLLEPMGRVEARPDGKKWTLRFTPAGTSNVIEAQFEQGKKKAKLRGANYELPGNFSLINSRGYVPESSLLNLLPRLLDLTVQLHQPGQRLFIGGTGMRYSAELKKNPSRLVLTFPAAVAPAIATEPGKLRMNFAKDAVVSAGVDNVNYGDALIASTQFTEANGAAEMVVNANAPVIANFSDGGKTITIAAAAQQQAAAPQPQQPTHETPLPAPRMTPAPQQTRPPARFLVVIDAAHGGDDKGATLSATLAEKDVALAFARRLLHEFENKGIPASMLRTTDTTMTFDQRAQGVNMAHAAVYISVHASSVSHGVRLYTEMMPPSNAVIDRHAFLPWQTAQAPYLDLSSQVAGSVAAECNTRQIAVRAMTSALRPMNSIAAPAVAVELAPTGSKVEEVNNAKYQQNVAAAVAAGVAAIRAKLEAPRP